MNSKNNRINVCGSMTVEATVILPLFFFFFLSFYSLMEILRIQSDVFISLRETGKEMCAYGYMYDKIGNEAMTNGIIPSLLFSQLYVKDKVRQDIGTERLDSSPIVDGAEGISFISSSVLSNEEDLIDLRAIYYVQPDFSFLYKTQYLVCTRFLGRAWTGYDVTGKTENEADWRYVYITETGRVYHQSLECASLNITIKKIFAYNVDNERNEYGAKYKKCERCARGMEPVILYITTDGDRYHYIRECSGLKRTIFTVPLDEVGNRASCKRCN